MTIKEIIWGLNDLKADAETHRESDGTIGDVFQHDMDVLDAAVEILTSLQTADNGGITMPKIELKPCPFCGSDRLKLMKKKTNYKGKKAYVASIRCNCCNARGGTVLNLTIPYAVKEDVERDAVDRWNRRTENETD